jgi:hypothetical protein
MPDFNFVGPAYTAPSLTQNAQELINWYIEVDPTKAEGERGRFTLYPTPGLTVLALPAGDALADPEGFAFARDFARARGYRLALDMPGPELLAAFPPDRVGVELLRLPWSPGLAALAPALPPGRVVLVGADRAAAIGWGWEAGVTLFEGRLLRPRAG